MIDSDGFRENVGIVLSNRGGRLFWARRVGMDAWQFPQGGIKPKETPTMAMYRELKEEVGLGPDDVQVIAFTRRWLRYRLPKQFVRYNKKPVCIGQKQIWFLLRLVGNEREVRLDCCAKPEFDQWQWVSYWYPLHNVVEFKKNVYKKALTEFAPLLENSRTNRPADATASTLPYDSDRANYFSSKLAR